MSLAIMPRRSAGKKQVAYRLDTKLLDCIDSLQVIYPRFSATDIVDLMLKGFIAAHDVGSATGEGQLDRAVGQYLRGQFDRALEEAHERIRRHGKDRHGEYQTFCIPHPQ